MRLRKIPGIDDKILSEYPSLVFMDNGNTITEDFRYRIFPDYRLVSLEIGMGKGDFICQTAAAHPDEAFIGVEMHNEVLIQAAGKISGNYPNISLISERAENLLKWLNPGDIHRIYLNFSDPWPKYAHRKRRLTYRNYLNLYRMLLDDNGEILVRTDSMSLFEFTLTEMSISGFILNEVSLDFHNSPYFDGILSEYERKKSKDGPIYYGRFTVS